MLTLEYTKTCGYTLKHRETWEITLIYIETLNHQTIIKIMCPLVVNNLWYQLEPTTILDGWSIKSPCTQSMCSLYWQMMGGWKNTFKWDTGNVMDMSIIGNGIKSKIISPYFTWAMEKHKVCLSIIS